METKELLSLAFKMTISLGAVLLVFAVSLYLFRKFSSVSGNGLLKKSKKLGIRPLEVLAYQSLGAGKGIYLVRCLEKKVLVGATQQSVQHLMDVYDSEDEVSEEETQDTSDSSNKGAKSSLSSRQFLEELRAKDPAKATESFQSKIKSDLREIARV
jgi:flagellar biogenesis protein FliO